jgi:hypothetical protein
MSKSRQWSGPPGIVSLPEVVEKAATMRCKNVLQRHGVSADKVPGLVQELIDQLGYAHAAKKHTLDAGGRGRPLDGAKNILSAVVADILGEHGVRGNWLLPGDEEEDGAAGPVAEIETILQSALEEANGGQVSTVARPARVSKARKTLGKVHRS